MTSEHLQLQLQLMCVNLGRQLVSAHPKWLESQGGNVGNKPRIYLIQGRSGLGPLAWPGHDGKT